jgi:hypothetical protein
VIFEAKGEEEGFRKDLVFLTEESFLHLQIRIKEGEE